MTNTPRDMDDDEKTPSCFSWWKRLKRLFRRNRRRKTAKHSKGKKEDAEEEMKCEEIKPEAENDEEMKADVIQQKLEQEEDQEVEVRVTQGEGATGEGEEKAPETGEEHGEEKVEEVIHLEEETEDLVKEGKGEEKVEEVIHSEKDGEEVVKEEKGEENVEEVIHQKKDTGKLERVEKVIHAEKDTEEEDEEEQGVAAAGEDLAQGALCVSGATPTEEEEGWTVVRHRKKRPRKKEALPGVAEAKASSGEAPRRQVKATPRKARRERPQAVSSVRASWQEEVTEAVVPVAPHMRRHIVGPRGATLRELLREFDGVSVAVPPPRDTVTRTVTLRGPPLQVNGAAKRVQSLLQDAQVVEAQVEVVPEQRRHVVGPGGATVRRLRRQFPGVAVIVPAADNRAARFVRLKGPRRQVTGAQAFIQACLEAAHAAHTTPGHVRPTANHLPANHQARTHAHGPSCHTAHHPSRRRGASS
uniref:K Homology domain-containing protein n=1 Tax=Scylla olivacea TaxID=85551 RepID=A0A0P4W3V1_SCYOL